MFFVVTFELFQEVLWVVQKLKTGSVKPVFLFFDGAFDFLHDDFVSFGLNHILEQNDATSENDYRDFGWVFVRLYLNQMISFQSINGFQTFREFGVCILNFEINLFGNFQCFLSLDFRFAFLH